MAALLRNLMPLPSKIRFVLWRILSATESITVRLYGGEVLTIRRSPHLDLEVAFEVYVSQIYSPPRALEIDSIRRVVDVGANVGYTLVFLARRFPASRFLAFEPHPLNARQAAANIVSNRLQDRVTLRAEAAGTARGRAFISDRSAGSRITRQGGLGLLPVQVVDFFETVGSAEIDLLKIDCEGGEYDLVMDPRFENLRARVLVMEWHLTKEHPAADVELMQRLAECGWELLPTCEYRHFMPENGLYGCGLVWGFRG